MLETKKENPPVTNIKKNIKKIPDLPPETDLKIDTLVPDNLESKETTTEKEVKEEETSEE